MLCCLVLGQISPHPPFDFLAQTRADRQILMFLLSQRDNFFRHELSQKAIINQYFPCANQLLSLPVVDFSTSLSSENLGHHIYTCDNSSPLPCTSIEGRTSVEHFFFLSQDFVHIFSLLMYKFFFSLGREGMLEILTGS